MAGYKCAITLAGQKDYPEAFAEAEDLLITLRDNLNDRLCTVPTNELAKILDLLPVSQLASVLAALLAEESEFPDPSGERLQIISFFTSRLVYLLPDKGLPPEIFELANQIVSRPGTEEPSFKDRADIAWDIAYLLGYKSNYLPTTQATTQLPTPQAATH
jgi:hypothetical protein